MGKANGLSRILDLKVGIEIKSEKMINGK